MDQAAAAAQTASAGTDASLLQIISGHVLTLESGYKYAERKPFQSVILPGINFLW